MSGGHTVTLSKFRNPVLAAFPTQCSALINTIKTKNVTQQPESNNSAKPYGHSQSTGYLEITHSVCPFHSIITVKWINALSLEEESINLFIKCAQFKVF